MVDDDAMDSDYYPKHGKHEASASDDDYDDDEDEMEEDDEDLSFELGCPFCLEDYDALGLCLHVQDQHLVEIKSGVCPICAMNAGKNMVSHLIVQHESMLKSHALHKLKRCGESYSITSLLRKKLQDEYQRSRKESSTAVSSSNVAPDPLLLSFINSPPQARKPEAVLVKPSSAPSLSAGRSDGITSERSIPSYSSSRNKDHGEKAKKREFLQTLLFSTIFQDDL